MGLNKRYLKDLKIWKDGVKSPEIDFTNFKQTNIGDDYLYILDK